MSGPLHILAVSGSLGASSKNSQLLRRAIERAPSGTTIELADSVAHLPHFDPEIGTDAAVERWREALRRSDALLIASPEYAHSLPGSLKNAIDWVIGSGELWNKVVAITAATASATRGLRGLAALATTLRAGGARLVGGVPIVVADGLERQLDSLLHALVVALHNPHPHPAPTLTLLERN